MTEPEVRHLETEFPVRRFASKAAWTPYARWLRRHARVSLGLLPEQPRCALKARVFGKWEGAGYSCEKACFESLPGFLCTGNLFRPLGKSRGRRPGILCPHGHFEDGRLHDHDPQGSVIARCVNMARMGMTVFSWDMVGYNDSCQVPHHAFRADDPHWGFSLMALQSWNAVRAMDFMLSLPDVDPRRIGATGASGGGSQTFTLMAVDDRLAAAAPICMVSYHYQGGCICENTPLLRLDGTNVELVRTFAPKPVFVGSCTGDWTCNTPDVELPAIRQVYGLMGARDRVSGLHIDYQHSYNRELCESVYGFFNRHLLGARTSRPLRESPWGFRRPPMRDRMLWWGRDALPPVSDRSLRDLWRSRCEAALRPHLRTAKATRKGLGPLLPHVLGVTPTSLDGYRGREPETLSFAAEGRDLAVRRARKAARPQVQFPDTYNHSPLARQVHEILAVLEAAGGRRRLVAGGGAGPACLLAGALSKQVRALDVDLGGFDPDSDASWRRHFDVPSIRQVGGLAAAFALLAGRRLELRSTSPALRGLSARYAK